MKHYLETTEAVLKEVNSSASGLTAEEAAKRLETIGKNKLDEPPKPTLLARFIEQFKNPMIIVLIAAAVISAVTGIISEGKLEADVFIILFVVLANAVLGVYQENKAESAIEALQAMSAAQSKVYRSGELIVIPSSDLVPGDVITLEAGDNVPADCRILEAAALKAEESALTGESVPSEKESRVLEGEDVPLGDRKNMLYMGSSIAYGRADAVVVATGMKTEMGKIAGAIAEADDDETPLQKSLDQLSKILSIAVLVICVIILGLNIVQMLVKNGTITLPGFLESFMIAVSLAVAAIPEGLAAVVTVVLSIGVTNMSKRGAIIRRLTAVEALGCAQVICSDKTGTLTQNKMTVVQENTDDKELLAKAMALCCDAQLNSDDTVTGEPTEAALVAYAHKCGLKKYELEAATPRVAEAPFDSLRKMMTTVHKTEKGFVQYTKGAPDEVLKNCTHMIKEGGVRIMTESDRLEILRRNKEMADQALRVLLAAYREYDEIPDDISPEGLERELIYIGMTGMIDPVRPEVKDAIGLCRSAGIRPVMITGDHRDTAVAIAKELGILGNGQQALTGAELSKIPDDEFNAHVEDYSVYARVQPEHKVRIVNAWRKKGMTTAMTGDGVNDAPSIKSADIGVGMGITGTDVTKNVADMVLTDDNFATIVGAVEEGRRIYDNIRKAIQFLLSSNLSEVLCILIATLGLAGLTDGSFVIFNPVHLLWINLISDCFPAIALGMEPAEDGIMSRKPRSSNSHIFSDGLGINLLWQGTVIAALTLVSYVIGYQSEGHGAGMTMAFITLCVCEMIHAWNMRSLKGSVFTMKKHNKVLIGAIALSAVLTLPILFIPALRNIFSLSALSGMNYLWAFLAGFCILPIVEIVKCFQRAASKK
ncbi:cation-translocating P-type ATPase [Ruminococcus flavefaciens]|uniref:P-type Ca(2+) transporter n=1 Tax=Ruminococcus flavefaciens TaxID=1265 RepID=A0A315XZN7_RUMFL|nr:cation-translocating P-type ATPase [Ruminococcus flavefaciens]PWJ13355.1 Ca2+-transporting ATPase [Ruminococcus flavefaciens]SSA47820.1 Ca2+-transporting ATPase [Ruminococcus flavefaciens]